MKNFILISMLFISFKAFNQAQHVEFIGFLTIKGVQQQINYKLIYTEENGIIEGFSYSDIGKENETKAKIKGKIQKNKIEFSETEIVYSNQSTNEFCLLKVKGDLKKINDSYSIKAKFTGFLQSNGSKKCGSGEILLMRQYDLLQKLEKSKILDKIDSINGSIQKNEINTSDNNISAINSTPVLIEKKEKQIVKKDKVYEFYTKDKFVNLTVQDHNEIDGDRITILQEDKILMQNELLSKDKKTFTIPVDDSTVDIILHSTADGYLPPNTALILLEDSKRTQDYELDLEINQRAIIRIIRIQ